MNIPFKNASWRVTVLIGILLAWTVTPVVHSQPTVSHPPGHAVNNIFRPLSYAYTPVLMQGATPSIITGPLVYHGGPVQDAPKVYVVFWGWTTDPSGEAYYLTNFLSSLGGHSWLSSVAEYGGGNPTTLFGGSWADSTSVPTQPTDAQIQNEALAAITHFGLGTSVNNHIIVATPTGHSTSGFGVDFCAYHSPISAYPSVSYTNLPYMTDAG